MTTAQRALIVSAAAFVALTMLAATGWVVGADGRVTTWIFGWQSSWRGAMHAVWWSATRPIALVWIALAVVISRKPQPAVAMTAAALCSWGLALATKQIVGRARPTLALLGAPPRDALAGHGYPSAHAALAAALAVPVVFVVPPHLRTWAVGVATAAVLLVAVSRTYSGAHFALDALGGIALGVMCGAAATVLFSRVRPRIDT